MGVVSQNQQASASVINAALQAISTTGQTALTNLLTFQEVNLLGYQNIQSYINSRRVLASRYQGADVLLSISASDFGCIDQGLTSASIRADSGIVTTKETSVSITNIANFKFSTSTGSATQIDRKGRLFTVVSNTIPTGQFDVVLNQVVDCSIINFEVLNNPNNSTISVYTSSDGITYTAWTNVSVNGYKITALGNTPNTNYIRITILPGAPDLLLGNSYSFGLTSFTVRASQFALRSEFNSRAMTISPTTANLYFGGTASTGVSYYVSASSDGTGMFVETNINTAIPIPGAQLNTVQVPATVVSSQNVLSTTLPAGYYPSSLKVQELISGNLVTIPVLPGLSSSDPNLSKITSNCIYVQGTSLILLTTTALTSRQFQVSYYTGPSSLVIKLKVVLDTASYGSTPSFNSVYFEAF